MSWTHGMSPTETTMGDVARWLDAGGLRSIERHDGCVLIEVADGFGQLRTVCIDDDDLIPDPIPTGAYNQVLWARTENVRGVIRDHIARLLA